MKNIVFKLGVLLLCFVGKLQATIWYVHPDSTLNSIQAGLDSCLADDTVLVGLGTYYENLVWPDVQSIVLMSEYGSDSAIIDGGSSDNVIYIHVDVDPTTIIDGFTIQNGYSIGGGGIYCEGFGVCASPTIMNNNIIENTNYGISCVYTEFLHRTSIISNSITDNTSGGIWLEWCEGFIQDNTITGNGCGVALAMAFSVITGNVISDNNGDGISSCYAYVVENNNGDRISNYASRAPIHHNTIANNHGNGVDILTVGLGSTPALNYNNIIDNVGYGVFHQKYDVEPNVNAKYNWWGDASGPGGVGPGIGDEVSAYVDYHPWLSDSVGIAEEYFSYQTVPYVRISPNPFKERVLISFSPMANPQINIHDVSGRLIRSFGKDIDADCVIWDGRDNKGSKASSGVYFLKFISGDFIHQAKVLLLR